MKNIVKKTFSGLLMFTLLFSSVNTGIFAEDSIDSDNNASCFYGMRGLEPEIEEPIIEKLPILNGSNSQIGDVYGVNAVTYPASKDISTSTYFPPIKSQGSVGSCSAFSAVYYQFTYEANKLNKRSSASLANQYSPQWAYYATYLEKENNMGVRYTDVYNFLKDHGALSMADNPYVSTFNAALPLVTDEAKMRDALKTRVSAVHTYSIPGNGTPITSCTDADLNEIKSLLNANKVVRASSTFNFDAVKTDNGSIYYRNKTSGSGHSFVIVGYNDNISYDVNKDGKIEAAEKGAFKVANSWGSSWGNNGYIWILYDALNNVSAISGSWEKNLDGDRQAAFAYEFANNNYTTIDVANYDVNFIAKCNFSSTQRNAPRISLGKSNGTGFSTYNTVHNGNFGTEKVSNFTLLFDYKPVEKGLEYDYTNTTWRVSLRNFDATRINDPAVSLIDNAGNTVKNMTRTSTASTRTYDCSINLVMGDLNYSGTVTSADMTRLNKYLSGEITFSNVQFFLADLNGDGAVNSKDLTRLMKILAGE